MGKKDGWDVSAFTQGQERACGFSITFVRHRNYMHMRRGLKYNLGVHFMLEVLWLWDVHISWNWY